MTHVPPVPEPRPGVKLSTGQTVELQRGVVVVARASEPHHFCLTVRHRDADPGSTDATRATAATYESLISFLEQLEALDYVFIQLERVQGASANAAR